MNKITLIIGNGMDLQLNLPTTFNDFYDWINKNRSNYKNIFLPPNAEILGERIEEWSDFEKKFPEIIDICFSILNDEDKDRFNNEDIKYYTNYMKNNFSNIDSDNDLAIKIVIEFSGFLKSFEDYLKSIENIFFNSGTTSNVLDKVAQDFLKIDKLLGNKPDIIDDLHRGFNNNQDKLFSIITLNYTDVVDQLSNRLGKNIEILIGNKKYKFTQIAKSPLYLHGKINRSEADNGIVIGTYSPKVLNKRLLATRQKNLFSKVELIEKEKKGHEYKKVNDILNGEQLFILYGLSLGDSDKILISRLLNKLINTNSFLIIYYYDNEYQGVDEAFRTNLITDKILTDLTSQHGLSDTNIKAISEKLFVVPIDSTRNYISNECKLLSDNQRSKLLNGLKINHLENNVITPDQVEMRLIEKNKSLNKSVENALLNNKN